MTAAQTMPVAERFASVNGEGAHAGQFSTFVRFRGCNLACSYCDTQWACSASCPVEELSVDEICAFVIAQKTPCVTLTGGEPLLQPALPALVAALLEQTSCFVELETNGACDIAPLAKLRLELRAQDRLGFTLDAKSLSSGMADRMLQGNYRHLTPSDCVKFVVADKQDLDHAAALVARFELLEACPVFFSPVFGQIDPADIVTYLAKNNLRRARAQVQLHKVIWPNVEKGV